MITRSHTHNFHLRRWMLLISMLLIGYLVQAVLAQDTVTMLDEITNIPPTSSDPVQPSATATQSPPTLEATLAPSVSVPTEATLEATFPPTAFVSIPIPTDLLSTIASITIVPSALRVSEHSGVAFRFVGQGLANVYSVAIACQTDPTMLLGTQALLGTWFSADPGMVTDSGFQSDGQWMLTAAQPGSVGELADSGNLWTLNYQVIATGLTQIVCEAYVFDVSGSPLPLAAAKMVLTVEGDEDTIVELPAIAATALNSSLPSPTVTEMPEVVAAVEESTLISPAAEVTQDSTQVTPTIEIATMVSPASSDVLPAEMITASPTPAVVNVLSHLSGVVEVSQPLMQAVVTIIGADVQQTLAVEEDGSFAVDIPSGSYEITFSAPDYLSYTLVGLIPAQPITLAPVTLIGDAVNESQIVDGASVALVIENFGLTVPPAVSEADLNGDHVVNIFDLALVSANAQPEN